MHLILNYYPQCHYPIAALRNVQIYGFTLVSASEFSSFEFFSSVRNRENVNFQTSNFAYLTTVRTAMS